jgi:two-component system alkaline phosphatase synthesis response regulator PhoP
MALAVLRGVRVEDSPGKGRRRILVVEDDDGVAGMLAICLTAGGFEASRASLGGEALAILEREPVDAVILDLSLPDGLGKSVLDRLRKPGASSSAYLVISALERGDVMSKFGPPEERFVPKPFDPWVLIGKLEKLLEGSERAPIEGDSG